VRNFSTFCKDDPLR